MEQVIIILSLSIGSVFVSYAIKSLFAGHLSGKEHHLRSLSKWIKLLTMFALEPISMLSSFWSFTFKNASIFSLPFVGIILTIINTFSVLIMIKASKMEPYKAGSVFTSGVFSNLQTFGGLSAYILFGVQGYSLMMLVNLLVSPVTYFIGYPMAHQISKGASLKGIFASKLYASQPYLGIPFAAILIGSLLNVLNIPQPEFLPVIRSFFIPFTTTLLGVSIGITLSFAKVGNYKKELALIFITKFVISPLAISLIGYLFGLHTIMEGLPFKVAIVASVMPVAFKALIPPALYGSDLDLANSAWITTTLAFALVLPVVYLVLLS